MQTRKIVSIPTTRTAEAPTVAKRYKVPLYVDVRIRANAPSYGSLGRTIQVGAELLTRLHNHPIPLDAGLKRGIPGADEKIGMTYKLVPRTIDQIYVLSERYETIGQVFEAIATILERKYIF
jgi:hypothetical protein